MKLISVNIENGIEIGEVDISTSTFKKLSLKEDAIEEFLRKNINVIADEDDETLLIVGKQVTDSERGRSDLTAVDKDGNIVLIEIKRDLKDSKHRKEPMELQAIRYAASLARIETPTGLVSKIFESYIEKYHSSTESDLTANEKANRLLHDFLSSNNALKTFNTKQRIVLVASAFEKRTLSSVAWLISNKIDITCYRLQPVVIDNDMFLEVDKILPVPSLGDYYTEVKDTSSKGKTISGTTSEVKRRHLPRIPKLFEWGILKSGDRLEIKNREHSEAIVVDSKTVTYNNENMTYNAWGVKVTEWSSICIYDWAVIINTGKTLGEMRLAKLETVAYEEA